MHATDPLHPAAPAPPDGGPAGWLRLEQTPGVGLKGAHALLAAFASPAGIFAAPYAAVLDALLTVQPPGRQAAAAQAARAVCQPAAPQSAALAALLDATLAWQARADSAVLTLDHPAYPPLLRQIADPPLLLYARGRSELLSRPALAVVGSRNASVQGVANAERFAASLSAAGLTIVSGLALGIDAAAHRGGLGGAGSTVAVVGTGADRLYPARNRALALEIAAQGCLVSEYALGTPALAANFPRRNRVISGLARGVLVVEAAAQSGSLITAEFAGEQGRDVFAIPGSIHATLSKGCHMLIKQGALLAETADDVLHALRMTADARAGPAGGDALVLAELEALLAALGHDPAGTDALAARAGLAPEEAQGRLLALELAGLVERLPGGLFQRVVR